MYVLFCIPMVSIHMNLYMCRELHKILTKDLDTPLRTSGASPAPTMTCVKVNVDALTDL
jgi:hypothetical protein